MIEKIKAENKGITLVALLVAIIVLLILATITIKTITGNESIFEQSIEAKEESEIKAEMKIVDLAANQAKTKDKYGDVKEDNLKEALEKNVGKDEVEVEYYQKGDSYFVIFKKSGRKYEVTASGYTKYIGTGENIGILTANPKVGLTPKNQYIVEVTLKTIKENNTNTIQYVWSKTEDKVPTNEEFDNNTKTMTTVAEEDSENEKKCTVATENDIEYGQYYLWVRTTVREEIITEHFGPYIIGDGIIQLVVDPNGGTLNGMADIQTIIQEDQDTITIGTPIASGYTVLFNSDGESNVPAQTSTKTFREWVLEGEGTINGTQFTFGTKNALVTAQYIEGGITLPELTRTGYTLNGWKDEAGNKVGNPGEEYKPQRNITLTAIWKVNEYRLCLDSSGGIIPNTSGWSLTNIDDKMIASKNVEYNSTYGTLPTPTRDGYSFEGWYTEASGGTKISTDTTMPAEDTTYYAYWRDIKAPTITVTAYKYDATKTENKGEKIKNAQIFENDGTYTVNTSWINYGVTYEFTSTDSDIASCKWQWNAAGKTEDTGDTWSNSKTSTSLLGPTDTCFGDASGWRKAQYIVTDTSGNTRTIDVYAKIDVKEPTVSLGTNGGTYTIPTSGKATIKTKLTASDEGGSTLNTLQYAWSTSKTAEPTTWTSFTNGATVSKTDISSAATWYLWTKVTDKAGNLAKTVRTSNGFVVKANTDTNSKITFTRNPTAWTNGNVTVTISYGSTLTAGKKAGQGASVAAATSAASTSTATSITVSTQNNYVYAEATDAAGNKVTASVQITNIDKIKPTISSVSTPTNGLATSLIVSATDTGGSGLSQYGYSTTNDSSKATWKTSSTITGLTPATTYYIFVKDGAGNISSSTSKNTLAGNWQVASANKYDTWQHALSASSTGNEIKLLATTLTDNTTGNISGKNITMNLNGKTLNRKAGISIASGYTLTFKGGTMQYTGGLSYNSSGKVLDDGKMFYVNGGTLNVESGTLKTNAGSNTIEVHSGGTVNVKGGTITSNTDHYQCHAIWVNDGTINISGGTLTRSGNPTESDVAEVIDGEEGTVINITGGTIRNNCSIEPTRAIYSMGTVKVNGANVLIQNTSTLIQYATIRISPTGSLTFSKGTIKNTNSSGYAYSKQGASGSVKGTWTK